MSGTVPPPDFILGSVYVCVILFYVDGFSGLFLKIYRLIQHVKYFLCFCFSLNKTYLITFTLNSNYV